MSARPAYLIGSLCILGGVIGFVRRSSIPSLVGGVTVGLLYLYGANAIQNGAPNGLHAVCAASALLFLSSVPRVAKGPVPLMLTLLGATTITYYGRAFYLRRA